MNTTWGSAVALPDPLSYFFMKILSAQKLSLLNQTILKCVGLSNEREIVKKFVNRSVEILDADYGYSWFREFSDPDFKWLFKSSNTPYTPKQPRKKGIMAKIFHSKQPIFIEDVFKAGFVRSDVKNFMKSVAVIPVSYKKSNYGTLVICFYKKTQFNEDAKNLLKFIGNSAAQAITISRLYNNLKKERLSLEIKVRDRTKELHETNQKLARDKAEDEAILTSIGEGIIATNLDSKIILANPQAGQILGENALKLIGKNLFDVQKLFDERGNEIQSELRPIYQALKQGKRVEIEKHKTFCLQKSNGTMVPISITATPIILKGKIIGAIQVLRDVSHDREIDRAKSELISLVSHELRTPLSGINWYVEALMKEEMGKLKPEQKKYLNEVYQANKKLVDLVYDFLNVSRIELGTFNVKLSDVNLKEITESILEELKGLIKEKRLKIVKFITPKLPTLQLDRKIIRLILQNIITNAVKYTAGKGKISLTIKLHQKTANRPELFFSVTDSGAGIPQKDQPKIFSKLYRADNIKKFDANGSGLGLYIVKSFVELCEGRIWFKSTEGRGTTFYVTIPLNPNQLRTSQLKTNTGHPS